MACPVSTAGATSEVQVVKDQHRRATCATAQLLAASNQHAHVLLQVLVAADHRTGERVDNNEREWPRIACQNLARVASPELRHLVDDEPE